LAKELGISQLRVSALVGQETTNGKRIKELARIFGVTASQFIEWGE
jgi:transposase-like protein